MAQSAPAPAANAAADSAAATDAPVLLREDCGGVATLTLNRPAQFNALSEALIAALQRELDELAQDDSVRAVVLAAAGRAFCAGHDLKEMRARPQQNYYRDLFARCGRMMQSLLRLPQPVLAKVHGVATAAGCQLVATCDLALAADHARFATSGVNLGLFCSTPAVAVSRAVARKDAFELLFTGSFIGAEHARSIGLVNRVVAAAELDAAVAELAAEIAAKPPVAVRTGKAMFYRQLAMPLPEAYQFAGEVMAANMLEADTQEGVDAFIEKRPPVFRRR